MKAGKFVRLITSTSAQTNSPVAKQVEFRQVLGQPNWVVEGENVYPGPEADFPRALRNRREHHLWGRKDAIARLKMMLTDPEAIITELLGIFGLFDNLVIEAFM